MFYVLYFMHSYYSIWTWILLLSSLTGQNKEQENSTTEWKIKEKPKQNESKTVNANYSTRGNYDAKVLVKKKKKDVIWKQGKNKTHQKYAKGKGIEDGRTKKNRQGLYGKFLQNEFAEERNYLLTSWC